MKGIGCVFWGVFFCTFSCLLLSNIYLCKQTQNIISVCSIQKFKGKSDFSCSSRLTATVQCGNNWMQTTAAAIHMQRMVSSFDRNSSLIRIYSQNCMFQSGSGCPVGVKTQKNIHPFSKSNWIKHMKHYINWSHHFIEVRTDLLLSLLLIRELWQQSSRSFKSGVSLQHRGPSVLSGVQLWTSGSERHGHLLPRQLRIAALHTGESRDQARLSRPVKEISLRQGYIATSQVPCFTEQQLHSQQVAIRTSYLQTWRRNGAKKQAAFILYMKL